MSIWRLRRWHVRDGKTCEMLAACALTTFVHVGAHAQSGYGCEYIPPPPPQSTKSQPPRTSLPPAPYHCDKLNPVSTVAGCDKKISEDEQVLADMQRDVVQHATNVRSPDFDKTLQCLQLQIAWDRATRTYVRAHSQQFNKSP
jgi:hypothetical protein